MLFDAIAAEGGRPFNQRFKPRNPNTERRLRRREDTVRRCALCRPIAGREGRRNGGWVRCCCCDQLNHTVVERLMRTGNKYSNNQSSYYPIPVPSQLFTHAESEDTGD